jgi:Chaperone of endosialidase
MAITTPDAVPGEVIEAAWGDAVRADLNALDAGKFPVTGGVISGNISLQSDDPALYFYDGANLRAYIQAADGPPQSLSVGMSSGIGLRVIVGGVDRFRIVETGHILMHKFGSDVNTPGIEYPGYGAIAVTQTTAANNIALYKGGAAVGNFQGFETFYANGAQVGNITLNGTSNGTMYNTTSDRRLKSLTRLVDPEEALDKVGRMEPINFTWKDNPSAGEQVGFFAQDLYTVAPEAVAVGRGEPGDEPDPNDPASGFVPWMADHTAIVPTLVAAIQALTRRLDDLTARLEPFPTTTGATTP